MYLGYGTMYSDQTSYMSKGPEPMKVFCLYSPLVGALIYNLQ